MSRRIRLVVFALAASIVLSTSACANVMGPQGECEGGSQNSDTRC